MKTTSIFLVCMMLARVAMAQFEGVIEMKVTSLNSDGQPEMTMTATNSIKGTSMLIETLTNVGGVTMKQATLVRGQEPNKIYMLDREKKTYTEMDLSGMVEGINRQQEEYEVKKMGNEKIQGHNCVHVQVKMKKSNVTMDMWTTKELLDWDTYSRMQHNNPMLRDNSFLAALRRENAEGMALKTVTDVPNGGGKTVMEVTKLEKKALPASLFEIPKDYKKSAGMFGIPGMEDMMKQFQKKQGEND
jgi:hypothetical protein